VSTPDDFTADDDLAVEDSDEELELDDELPLEEDEDDLALDEDGDAALALDDDVLAPIDDFAGDDDDAAEETDTAAVVPVVVADEEEEEEGPDLDEETDDVVDDAEAEGEESLDVLLSREKVTEDDDLGRLEEPRDGFTVPAQPISPNEFTCRSCFLVKNRAQLADEEKLFCLDCA
jgi:GT2 family glycosyltransferase